MVGLVVSFLFHDRYKEIKDKQRNEVYTIQSSFTNKVLR